MDFSLKRFLISWGFISALCSGAFLAPAAATTTNATLGISATVMAYCAVANGSSLSFGNYDPSSGSATTGSVNLSLTCNSTTPTPTIGLDGGTNYSGTTNRMINGSDYLSYQLLQSAGGSSWTNASTPGAITITSANTPQTVTVYGSIASGQLVPAGAYSDTVNVTVTY